MKDFDLDPNLLSNGRRLSESRFSLMFDTKNKFDDNVTNTLLENDPTQSHKESFLNLTEIETKYDYVFLKKFIVSPYFRVDYTKYTDQDSPTVFQNDSILFTTSLKNRYEHIIKNAPATFNIDLEYAKTYKDYNESHHLNSYVNEQTIYIGEQCTLNQLGDTNFKFKYKFYNSYNSDYSNHSISLSSDQTIIFKNYSLLIALLEVDLTNNYNDTSTNTNAYLLRLDYIIPEIMPKYTLTTSLASTLTDTLQQTDRGYETTFEPSIEMAKDITPKLKGILNFDYTINNSKSSTYQYHKLVSTLEFKYIF